MNRGFVIRVSAIERNKKSGRKTQDAPTLHTGIDLDKETLLFLIRPISVEYDPEF